METLIGILPFALLFLLCPLMMLFMHRGHDDHADDREALLRRHHATKDKASS
jgi:hypothetical protein